MLHFKFQHSRLWLFTLTACLLSSVVAYSNTSVAAPVTSLNQFQINQFHLSQSKTNQTSTDASQAPPCAQFHAGTQIYAGASLISFDCGDTDHNKVHCASCLSMPATLPTSLTMEAVSSSAIQHSHQQKRIAAITLANLSRPPISSLWF
ncbi:hypothetical protein [Vibrio aphrogenes]|uniref:hypothetical protein n=1 Tax=Vibrio aphrogenes TaxID=1891186 RepID=UPI000B34C20D|nr:hypothetical protein [Vibrio aphrogenes]